MSPINTHPYINNVRLPKIINFKQNLWIDNIYKNQYLHKPLNAILFFTLPSHFNRPHPFPSLLSRSHPQKQILNQNIWERVTKLPLFCICKRYPPIVFGRGPIAQTWFHRLQKHRPSPLLSARRIPLSASALDWCLFH